MSIIGWYYLHENGELIYKRDYDGQAADIRESSFARGLWPVDPADREGAWRIIVEGLAAGAKPERVKELVEKWQCDDEDGLVFAGRINVKVERDGNQWCAHREDFLNLHDSPAGFGSTVYESLAALAKELGYVPSKMWGATFADLANRPAPAHGDDRG